MVFHWCLSDCKSPYVFRTLHSILADLNNVVDWMVSTRPLISKSFSPCTNLLVTVPRIPITIGITVTFMFHSFILQGLRTYLSFRYLSVLPCGQPKSTIWQIHFLLTITRSGHLAEIRGYVCISKSQRIFSISFSRTNSGLCIECLLVWSNLNFLPLPSRPPSPPVLSSLIAFLR